MQLDAITQNSAVRIISAELWPTTDPAKRPRLVPGGPAEGKGLQKVCHRRWHKKVLACTLHLFLRTRYTLHSQIPLLAFSSASMPVAYLFHHLTWRDAVTEGPRYVSTFHQHHCRIAVLLLNVLWDLSKWSLSMWLRCLVQDSALPFKETFTPALSLTQLNCITVFISRR